MGQGRMSKDSVQELSPAEKIAIAEYTRTKNASSAIQRAYPGKYPDGKAATRTMYYLLRKPLARDYQKEIMKQIESECNVSKEWIVQRAKQLMVDAENAMDFSSSTKILFLLAKMMGYLNHKQVIDVRKTISLQFGGGYNPNQFTEVDGEIVPKELPETVQFTEEDKLIIQDDEMLDSVQDDL